MRTNLATLIKDIALPDEPQMIRCQIACSIALRVDFGIIIRAKKIVPKSKIAIEIIICMSWSTSIYLALAIRTMYNNG